MIELLNIKFKNNRIINYHEVQKNIRIQQQRSFDYLNKNFKTSLEQQEHKYYPEVYAAFRKDKSLRDLSASGGVGALLAEKIIEKKGVVWGACFAQDFRTVHHIAVRNMNEYYRLIALSKYNISSLTGVFSQVEVQLKKGILVLFTGTPCQIVALKKYLKIDYSNLMTVDLLCHGVSKKYVLSQYIEKIENDYKSKVVNLSFRSQHTTTTVAIFENGEKLTDKDIVHGTFINEKYLYNMCKKCNRHYGNNVSDITLGDFWDIEKYITDDPIFKKINVTQIGLNKVKVNTDKGKELFNLIAEHINFRKI